MKIKSMILLVLIASSLAYADIGPKPSADYYVTYGGQEIEGNFRAVMLSCWHDGGGRLPDSLIAELNISEYDAARNCSWRPEWSAWGGDCAESRCSFTYMLPEEYRLAIYLPGEQRVYVSDVTQRKNFRSSCSVELLSGGGMKITEYRDNFVMDLLFFVALVSTLFLELLTAAVFVFVTKSRWRLLIYVAAANIISLPVVWFLFPALALSLMLILILAELFAVLFEASVLHLFGKLSPKRALLLSVLMNAASFLLGGLVILPLAVLLGA
jgi:hypothetical protein